MRTRRLWIFSDLHLENLESELGGAFLRALSGPAGPEDAVVFAGDVFELWVGNSTAFSEPFAPFLRVVRELLAKGVRVHYIEGNHDFHLSKALPDGVRIEPGEVFLELETGSGTSRRVLIEHGDLADRGDRAYLGLRAILRSLPARVLSSALPGSWIRACAGWISRPAARKEADLPEYWSRERRDRLRSVYREYARTRKDGGADWVVLGHCHDLDEWEGFYWNMGYPPVHRQFLVFDPGANGAKDRLERRNFL